MSERDFTIGDREFKLNKIDTFKQFHIARRLGPIMGDIFAMAPKIKKSMEEMEGKSEEEKLEAIAPFAKPVMDSFSKLNDADSEFVLLGLCSSVEMKQPQFNTWAFVARNGVMMIQDLELPALMQIAWRAFQYNISSFFSIAQQTSHGGK